MEEILWSKLRGRNPLKEIQKKKFNGGNFFRGNPVRAPGETDAIKKVDCLQEIS